MKSCKPQKISIYNRERILKNSTIKTNETNNNINLTRKFTENLKRCFTNEDIQMAFKHMKSTTTVPHNWSLRKYKLKAWCYLTEAKWNKLSHFKWSQSCIPEERPLMPCSSNLWNDWTGLITLDRAKSTLSYKYSKANRKADILTRKTEN